MKMDFKLYFPVAVRLFAGMILIFLSLDTTAQLRIPNIFTDEMILQRDKEVNIWGWAKPGIEVEVQLGKASYRATVKEDSTWSVVIPFHRAGGPYLLTVNSSGEQIKLKDIYFGDIWFCSGQSNMSFQVAQANYYEAELKDAEYPLIRELGLALESTLYPKHDIKETSWKKASAGTIGKFSAVAWFFAKELYHKTKVPIGIIHSSWGGTPIEAFMDDKTLQVFPAAKKKMDLLSPEFIKATQLKNIQLVESSGNPNPKGFINIRNGYPTLVYNAMVAPFFNFPVKGVLWYQGEANSDIPACFQYEKLLTGMITSWRTSWKEPDLPFVVVQLANYRQKVSTVSPISGWAVLQEAQYQVSQTLKNVGIVITNDIGNPFDAHPKNKQDVGKRSAAVALNKFYGYKSLVASGPSLRNAEILKDKMILSFDGIGSGLTAKGGGDLLNGFLIAGEDQQFYEATARISGDQVVVFHKDILSPTFVRYAFKDNPPAVNFYNKNGFPAVPFRTDTEKRLDVK
ncbi:MAG: sialate O-acetylesterase [Pedobacter sp.]